MLFRRVPKLPSRRWGLAYVIPPHQSSSVLQEGTSQHNHLDKGNLSTIRVVDFLKMHGELQFLSSSSQAPLKGEKTWGLPFSSPGWVEGQGWCAWAALTWGRFAYPKQNYALLLRLCLSVRQRQWHCLGWKSWALQFPLPSWNVCFTSASKVLGHPHEPGFDLVYSAW